MKQMFAFVVALVVMMLGLAFFGNSPPHQQDADAQDSPQLGLFPRPE